MRFELFIATRYLRAKRRQAFIGVITGISVLGVAAGVASLIVALAVNNGFRQDLQARLLGSTSHISLMRVQSDGIPDWRPLLEKLLKQPHVVSGRSGDLRAGLDFTRPARARRGAKRHAAPIRTKSQRPAELRDAGDSSGAGGTTRALCHAVCRHRIPKQRQPQRRRTRVPAPLKLNPPTT